MMAAESIFYPAVNDRAVLCEHETAAPPRLARPRLMSRVRGALRPTGAVANASSGEVKARLGAKGDDAFRKLQRMFLGAINTLDEDGIKQALVQNQSLIDAKYLEINKPIKDTGSTFLHTAVWCAERAERAAREPPCRARLVVVFSPPSRRAGAATRVVLAASLPWALAQASQAGPRAFPIGPRRRPERRQPKGQHSASLCL
jgi:hypothetical protein